MAGSCRIFMTVLFGLNLLPGTCLSRDLSRRKGSSELSQRCVAAVVVPGPEDVRLHEPVMVAVGTSFLLDGSEGFIATNAHVVHAAAADILTTGPNQTKIALRYPLRWAYTGNWSWQPVSQDFRKRSPLQNSVVVTTAHLLAIDDTADVALLRLTDKKALDETCRPQFSKTPPSPGTAVYYTGYPLNSEVPMSLWAHVATESMVFPSNLIAELGAGAGSQYFGSRILLDAPIQGGSSGSPVYSVNDGRIFGIASGCLNAHVTGGRGVTSAFGYVIPLDRLFQLMSEFNVPSNIVAKGLRR